MNENLYERKQSFLNYLSGEHAPKPPNWWQQKEIEFRPTWNAAQKSKIKQRTEKEISVRYNLKEAIITIAFFITGMFFLISKLDIDEYANPIAAVVFIAILFDALKKIFIRKPRIIISSFGLWTSKADITVEWKFIVSSYIKDVHGDDNVTHFLLIYFYDELCDEFKKLEVPLSGLDQNATNIAFHIESWKINSGYPSPEY